MVRTYRATGRPRGALPGNANALRHGFRSAEDRRRRARARALMRAAKACGIALLAALTAGERGPRTHEKRHSNTPPSLPPGSLKPVRPPRFIPP